MTLRQAILATLTYSDHFSFPLTFPEIYLRLTSSEPCSKKLALGTLRTLVSRGVIARTGDYYHHAGRAELVSRRINRAIVSAPLIARARGLSMRLAKLPGVRAVFLTGSLAMSNSDGTDDIDLMIVTETGRLWTTRILITVFTSLLGLRRTPFSTRNTGKLCLNLYLSPPSFLLPASRQSLYTAYELVQAVPLYDPDCTRDALLAANPWIRHYLPNFPLPLRPQRVVPLQSKGATLVLMRSIEFVSYRFQLAYMKSKITREYVTPDSAFFHPHDPSAPVLKKLAM